MKLIDAGAHFLIAITERRLKLHSVGVCGCGRIVIRPGARASHRDTLWLSCWSVDSGVKSYGRDSRMPNYNVRNNHHLTGTSLSKHNSLIEILATSTSFRHRFDIVSTHHVSLVGQVTGAEWVE